MKKVVVIGDIILDQYIHGDVTRTSPEAPIPILEQNRVEHRLGGAANVASALKYMGEKTVDVQLIGILGTDVEAEKVELLCFQSGVNPYIIHKIEGHPTTLKTRYLNKNQQLLRVDREEVIEHNIISSHNVGAILEDSEIVILSDYDKGALNPQTIRLIISYCNENDITTIVDPKFDNFWEYEKATIFKPNIRELRGALYHKLGKRFVEHNDIDTDSYSMIAEVHNRMRCDSYVVTDGDRGMSLINNGQLHFVADKREIIDVTGAGDIVVSTIAMCLLMGNDLRKSVYYSNKAAGLSVEQLGCGRVKYGEIVEFETLR